MAQADDAWNRLRLQGEAAALAPLLAEDRLLIHFDGRVQHRADDLQALAARPRRTPRIDNGDLRIRRYGDTGVVTGTSVQAAVSDGPPWEGRLRVTRVWVLHDGRWQSGRLAFVAPGADRALKVGARAGQNSSPCGEAFFGGVGATKRLQSSHGHCSREALKPRRLLASAKRRDSSCA